MLVCHPTRVVSTGAIPKPSPTRSTGLGARIGKRTSRLEDNRRMRSFEDLVAEADEVSVEGWDFSWLKGRATEERPGWGYARAMAIRLSRARAALDLQTGGGEVLAEAGTYPPVTVATEAWPPNLAVATGRLHPLGVTVLSHDGESALPFADGSFDLVTSRHPVSTDWAEVARVMTPGGTYFSQQVGPASMAELSEVFLGPSPDAGRSRRPEDARAAAKACGLDVIDMQTRTLRAEFHDVGAIVYILRKCVWWVPDFSTDRYLDTLRKLHQQITREGPFIAHASRFLIEARKPAPRVSVTSRHEHGSDSEAVVDPVDTTLATYQTAARRYLDTFTPLPALVTFLDRFAELVGDGTVLELGSGSGWGARYLEDRGLTVIRTDATQAFIDVMLADGHQAKLLDIRTDDLGGPYAAVLADAVLLHLNRNQFTDVITRARGAVVPGGVFAFTVKEGDGSAWTQTKLDLPRHFTYWREAPLLEILDRSGWSVASLDHIRGRTEPWLYVLARAT